MCTFAYHESNTTCKMKNLLLIFVLFVLGFQRVACQTIEEVLQKKTVNAELTTIEKRNDETVIINVIGDSYVANHRRDKSETWHYLMAQQLGMTYNNYGRNGACVAFDRTHDGRFNFGIALYQKALTMDSAADYVLVIAGHNDADKVGTNRDSLAMFRDSLQLMINNIHEQCPKARIAYVTPWYVDRPGFREVCKVIRKVCRRNHIPVLDNYDKKCIIKVRDEDFRRTYFQAPGDHAHLNAEGHKLFLPVAMKWFRDKVLEQRRVQ